MTLYTYITKLQDKGARLNFMVIVMIMMMMVQITMMESFSEIETAFSLAISSNSNHKVIILTIVNTHFVISFSTAGSSIHRSPTSTTTEGGPSRSTRGSRSSKTLPGTSPCHSRTSGTMQTWPAWRKTSKDCWQQETSQRRTQVFQTHWDLWR